MFKKIVTIITLMFTSFPGSAQVNPNIDIDWAYLGRYSTENKDVPLLKNNEKRVIFIGDSITEFWNQKDPNFFKENSYLNRGISGQTTPQFLLRFRQDVIDLKPKLIVINGGINDIAENSGLYNEDYTFGNIVSMVELAQKNNINVVLTSVLPAAAFYWNLRITDVPEKVTSLNKRIKEYALNNNLPYVDYYSSMVMSDYSLNSSYTEDGVHPILEGYNTMKSLIKPVIDKALSDN